MADPAESPGLPPLPGAEPLRAYIIRQDTSVLEWCEKHGLDRFSIQKLLSGKLQRVSVELAFDIEEATRGEVEAPLWVPTSEVRDVQREKRAAVARARQRAVRLNRTESGAGTDGTR